MIEVDKSDFHKLKPLFPDDHVYVEVPMIINDRRGRAWVDDLNNPALGFIYKGYTGFIEGKGDVEQLIEPIECIKNNTLEICCAKDFEDIIKKVIDNVTDKTNVLFSHDGVQRNFTAPDEFEIVKIDSELFGRLDETGEKWLLAMYDDADDFLYSNGMGFAAITNGRLASASTAFGFDGRRVNIGVATNPDFQRLGLSKACTSALIKVLLARNLEPVWITGPDNIASCTVAEKNGFTETHRLPVFWTEMVKV